MRSATEIATGFGCAALLCILAAGASAEDILKPEEAFRYEVSTSKDEITVTWTIEPGHYLYRKRMGYSSRTAGLEIGEPIYPQGLPHSDEFFGEMEIYRDRAVIRLPVTRRADDIRNAALEIRSQGCADIGLCYPPQKWSANLLFDSTPPATGKLQALLDKGAGSRQQPLPPELAFRPMAEVIDPFTIEILNLGYRLCIHAAVSHFMLPPML
jgi:thiol:disulfide interchange protein DsbD